MYASNVSLSTTERLFVANRGQYPWSSRIFRGLPCCGYRSSTWDFYALSEDLCMEDFMILC